MARGKPSQSSTDASTEGAGNTFGLMSQKQLSDLTGWSRITIDGWTKNDRDGPRLPLEREAAGPGRAAVYSLRRFIEWYAAREARAAVAAARKAWELERPVIPGATGDEAKDIGRQAIIAEAQSIIDKADMVAMDKAERLGELVVLAPVLNQFAAILQTIREGLNRAPKRLAQRVSQVRDEKRIESEAQVTVDEVLEEIEELARGLGGNNAS